MKKKPSLFWMISFAFSLPILTGFFGSLFTTPSINSWYITLNKPFFNPPNWLFGPAWTILYLLMGVSCFLLLMHTAKKENFSAKILYFIQLVLNLLWSIVFFGLHHIIGAFFIIILLDILVLITYLHFRQLWRPSSWYLLPYLAWISFATILNFAFWWLN